MATADYRDPRSDFAIALKAAGLVLEDAPLMDGKFHRVPVEGAKNGTRDGSYVGHLDGKPSGYIENFKTGHKETWTAASAEQWTPQERADAAARVNLARQQRSAERVSQHGQAADKVLLKWDGLADVPPTGQNAYLARKGVQAHGVKFDGERLVVPVRDIDGKLWSVQSIAPEEGAAKMFEKGARKAGNMHVIGEIKPGAQVLVAEGYATGASLHQATGKAVAVAFDAGNLDAVVGAIKQRHPTSPVLIMGDDDRTQERNVGQEKATAAAQKHGVAVAFPQFREPGKLSDFNDLHASEGLEAVRAQVEKALGRSIEQTRARAAPDAALPRDARAAERPKGAEHNMAEPKIDESGNAAPAAALPRHSVGDPNGWLNQNAQADRDRGDKLGVTAQIEGAFAKGMTAGQVRTELAGKLDKIAVEEQPGFIVNVRATLGITSRGIEEGQTEFAAWQAERTKRLATSDPSVERTSPIPATSALKAPTVTAETPTPAADEQLTARDLAIGTAHAAQLAKVGGPAVSTAVQAIGVVDAAKVVSDVAQGKDVKALDVASAAASVAMTTGVGGPAVQLGAQAVAGVSAIDAGQRALNTAEAKLKEPDPADIADRKGIERRNDEMLAVPRNALDEQTARAVVKQDVAALHLIDTPLERHAAAVAMGHNVQNQATYKAELARQDPYTAEVVALAFAQEQQKVAAKEDRKAPEISAVAPDAATIDSVARTARQQESVNRVEDAAPQRAIVNSIERFAQRETEIDVTEPQRSGPPLEDRFDIVTRFARGRDYHFRDQPGKVAFKERWLSMTSTVDTAPVVKAMLDRAQERGWTEIRVKGSEEFQRQAWIAATARGIKAVGYEPTDGNKVAANNERARLGKEPVAPLVQSKTNPSREQQPSGAAQDKGVGRDGSTEPFAMAQRHVVERPIAQPLRDFLTERGEAPKDVEAMVALASERMSRDRVHVGQVLAHGRDHYEFDKAKEQNYYVKLQSPAGEKVVWGVDLRRALEESQIKVGDNVALEHRSNQPVRVIVKDRDASGKVIGEHEVDAMRNTWQAANIEQLRREAVPEAPAKDQSAPNRDSSLGRTPPTTAVSVDRPTPPAARSELPTSRDAAIFELLEAGFDAKNIPHEHRADLRARVRKHLDVQMARAEPVKVAIYDPTAPSREPQRAVQVPQRQNQEHERSR